jgi:hypothetical protein
LSSEKCKKNPDGWTFLAGGDDIEYNVGVTPGIGTTVVPPAARSKCTLQIKIIEA